MFDNPQSIIIYDTDDGKTHVALYAQDSMVWMSQSQLAEFFTTSKQNISSHIVNVLKEKELIEDSVVKDYLTTAELRVKNRNDITMNFWQQNVDKILEFNEQPLLTKSTNPRGTVSHAAMEKKVSEIYQLFDQQRKQHEAEQADRNDLQALKQLEDEIKQGGH